MKIKTLSREKVDHFHFDITTLWLLRKDKSTWDESQQGISDRIKKGDILHFPISDIECALKEKENQYGIVFGNSLSSWKTTYVGALKGLENLN